MISYEELCQALDRHNAHEQNAAEMAQLEQPHDPALPVVDGEDLNIASATQEPMAADVPLDFGAAAEGGAPAAWGDEDAFAAVDAADAGAIIDEDPDQVDSEQLAGADAGTFAEGQKESTHELDVDEVQIDDRLADDKLPE